MNQVTSYSYDNERIRDPNLGFHENLGGYRDGGRTLINIMRSAGFDKSARNNMRLFLADAERNNKVVSKLNRKSMFKELSSSAHPVFAGDLMSESMGTYNPDDIPIDTYMTMKQDPQISLGLAVIKMPLLSLKWNVNCEDKDVSVFVTQVLKLIWNRLIKSMLTAVEYGFASHEKVWTMMPMDLHTTTGTGRKKTHFSGKAEIYKKIKAHYPDTVRIRVDNKTGDFLGIIQEIGGGQSIKLDKEKCFLFALEDDFGNFFGGSRLKNAYKPWYWKEILYQFMLRYYERRGSPPTVITFPPGINTDADGNEVDNNTVALRIGSSLVENSVITLPYEPTKDGRENIWKAEYMQDEKRGEMFIEAISHLETQILRGILVPERVITQDISTGSYSMASSHAEAFLLAQEGLISSVEAAINEELVPAIVEFNFKPKKWLPCTVNIEEVQHDRKKLLKEIYIELIRNVNTFAKNGKVPNLLPSISEMAKILKIPVTLFSEEYVDLAPTPGGEKGGAEDIEEKGSEKKGSATKKEIATAAAKRKPAISEIDTKKTKKIKKTK